MNLEAIRGYRFQPLDHEYTFKDSILYALGLGYGADPLDQTELRFVTEDQQQVVPTQGNVLAYPGFWARDVAELGFDWVRILHGEQYIELLRPIPPAAKVRAKHRIAAIDDKGEDKGAVVFFERELSLADTGAPLAFMRSTIFARGDGGQGGFGELPETPPPIAPAEPDRICRISTSSRAALIYRLSGDFNPIHANPDIAREAGFERPILHGMCTMGVACRALLAAYCDNRPERVKSMFVRFRQPVFPGESLRLEFFREKAAIRFRAYSVEREVLVLDRCSAQIAD